jgi:hypothetical protein
VGTAVVAGFPLWLGASPNEKTGAVLDPRVVGQLQKSPYVYISPLKSNHSESECHAELWYAWMNGAVIVTVATEGWKAQSVLRGLTSARLWVGDYGRWKGFFSNNEKFRAGPNFLAKGEIVKDLAVLDQLLTVYEAKYPEEIANWRDNMRQGGRDGSRVVIRYAPI